MHGQTPDAIAAVFNGLESSQDAAKLLMQLFKSDNSESNAVFSRVLRQSSVEICRDLILQASHVPEGVDTPDSPLASVLADICGDHPEFAAKLSTTFSDAFASLGQDKNKEGLLTFIQQFKTNVDDLEKRSDGDNKKNVSMVSDFFNQHGVSRTAMDIAQNQTAALRLGMEAMLLNSNKEVVITNDTDNIYGEPDSSFISKLDEINDLPKSARKLIYEAALMQLYLKPESFNKETPDEKRALANLKSVLAETKDNQPDSKWNQTVDAMLFKLDRDDLTNIHKSPSDKDAKEAVKKMTNASETDARRVRLLDNAQELTKPEGGRLELGANFDRLVIDLRQEVELAIGLPDKSDDQKARLTKCLEVLKETTDTRPEKI